MKLKIRKAKPSDWKTIQKLNNEVFISDAPHDVHLDLKWPFSQIGINWYKKALSNNNYCCLLAEFDGNPVSYLIGYERNYSYRKNRVGEIDNMGTLQHFRSKGIGSKLVEEFKKWCKQKGITHVRINAYFENQKAQKFYKKQGLKPIDITLEGKI